MTRWVATVAVNILSPPQEHDESTCAPTDVKPDTPTDMKPDTPTDVKPDTPTDVKPDTPTDVKPDTPTDVKPDTPTNVKPTDAAAKLESSEVSLCIFVAFLSYSVVCHPYTFQTILPAGRGSR